MENKDIKKTGAPVPVAPEKIEDPEIAETKEVKIYFLSNLMTAGNLFCGFLAMTKIVEADIASKDFVHVIHQALIFILLACIFDMLDGRVARTAGLVSPFGREFDSLADIISFGAAPAFLVYRIVLEPVFKETPEIGWFVASIYLICGALRLARFNCIAALPSHNSKPPSKDFVGLPIPAAAATVASITLFLLWVEEKDFVVGTWRYILPFMMVLLSYMMVSNIKYPSFKRLNFRTRSTFQWMALAILLLGGCFVMRNIVLPILLPLLFISYLSYGVLRTYLKYLKNKHKEINKEQQKDPSVSTQTPIK